MGCAPRPKFSGFEDPSDVLFPKFARLWVALQGMQHRQDLSTVKFLLKNNAHAILHVRHQWRRKQVSLGVANVHERLEHHHHGLCSPVERRGQKRGAELVAPHRKSMWKQCHVGGVLNVVNHHNSFWNVESRPV